VGSGRRDHPAAAPVLVAVRRQISERQGRAGRQRADVAAAAYGAQGPAFLAYPNFINVYLDWNNSLVYSTTAAYYATRLGGAPPLNRGNPEPFTAAETKQVQALLARQGFDVGKIDGVIGASTRDAIRQMQIKYGLPADGYPSHALLNRLQRGG